MKVNNLFKPTSVFAANMAAKEKVIVNQGGTWSGKTYSILQKEILITGTTPKIITTVAGQDVPNLRKGAITDFGNIIDEIACSLPENLKYKFKGSYNKTEKVYSFPNGSRLEFSSFKDWQDAKSGKRNRLFVNEANGISWKVYEQLAQRTRDQITIDYNPDAPFWAHQKLKGRKGVKFIYSNFFHNQFIPKDLKEEFIEKGRDFPDWWKVYGIGKTGKTEGVVFPDVIWVGDLPKDEHCARISYGLDWGYTNDPTALVKVVLYKGELYAKLLIYEKRLKYKHIAEKIKELKINSNLHTIICDHDQRGMDTLQDYYIFCEPAVKGAGSIESGIQSLKEYKMNIVNNHHWKAEQLAYKWRENKLTGEPIKGNPIDAFNHAWDALRYGIQGIIEGSNPYILM